MTTSINSPKNQFKAELWFSKKVFTGTVITVTMDEKNENHDTIQYYLRAAKSANANVTIVWKQNIKKFPEFEWVKI
jgi:hypothetical protein